MDKLSNLQRFKERENIVLKGFDPVSAGGFTQIPNFLINNTRLSFASKVVYAKLLSYAWHHDRVYPGLIRMSEEIGAKKSNVSKAVKELETEGFLEIERRGQGKTNIYTLTHTVQPKTKK